MQAPSYLINISGTYYAQVRVPSDIVKSYGRKQHRKSLKTKDYTEAVRLLHGVVADIKRTFDEHRAKLKATADAQSRPAPVTPPKSFADLGRQYGREIAEAQLTARVDLYEEAVANPKEFLRREAQRHSEADKFTYFDKLVADGDLDRVVGHIIRKRAEDRIADLRRMMDTGDMEEMLALASERSSGLDRKASVALALTLMHNEIGALQDSLSSASHAVHGTESHGQALGDPASATPDSPPVSLDDLFDKWKTEAKPSASTLSTWGGHIRALKAAFPEKAHDAGTLTINDMIKWKDDLVAEGLAAKTINSSYLACIRTLFNYALTNKLVKENPAAGVIAAGGRKAGTGMLPYTNAEVAKLLELAQKETNPAKRWLPWLAAQTGSRISEVAQLWGSYVKEDENGIHFLDIKPAPDAGSIKEEVSERTVPLHPQLIEDGFLEFVASKGDGPLFYKKSSGDPTKKHAAKGVSNKLAEWIRANGFTDPRKAPNHALRHWFKTHASAVGIQDRMVDKLQGHAPRSEADKYYHPELWEKLAALKKITLPPVSKSV